MTPELTYLAYSIALFFVIVLIQGYSGIANNGPMAMANNRDDLKPPTKFQARMKRLTDNYRENLWFFAPLVLIAAIAEHFQPMDHARRADISVRPHRPRHLVHVRPGPISVRCSGSPA